MPDPAGPSVKIATCCYCGARTALAFDVGRHELACANCGAPLSQMKALKRAAMPAATIRPTPAPSAAPKPAPARRAAPPAWVHDWSDEAQARRSAKRAPPPRPKKRGSARRRKSWGARMADWLEDAADEIGDIFD